MSPSHATKKNRRYHYYVCGTANKCGWDACPSKSIPAGEIERFVVDQIKRIGKDPALVQETILQVQRQSEDRLSELQIEQRQLQRDLRKWHGEVASLALPAKADESAAVARLADLQERVQHAERRSETVCRELDALQRDTVDTNEVAQALAEFDLLWATLTLREQCRMIALLVQRVDYDGSSGKVTITFHSTGLKTLAVSKEVA